ncbi:carboxylating nicotinate-nucleotide diphosphorylase [Amphritea balenae]|uniref:Probable nicotinate-nucleotide pyrophosphorylase [carboxylating] n=1 Tax=Amphritea balenae TaxID=452629 RepID=A0A3P1SSF3_9GAMM|nr:carboxylating nicotinate-nucleotide diphosphorylase [Amphritea balenae]RRD00114.1 carboxylating nicotinate-nucleotide diphosphorylase [Amphritea balenae]GGK76777.1 nicotinate-nucleotide pyrophosphorylase [carboxylating] [Amphritea balenae]
MANTQLLTDIAATVSFALAEDIGGGDITAQLIPKEQQAKARVICRQDAVICGIAWVNEVFRQVDDTVQINWLVKDGDKVVEDQPLFEMTGAARSLLTAERGALNFLQTLSATATISAYYASLVEGTGVKLLDTRKTIPGLRNAQKYAVSCGGCFNHRIGLYDAFLIKENHIMACGSVTAAVSTAKINEPGKPVEVEVESFEELQQALDAGADIIMLDNFDHAGLRLAVQKNKEHTTPAKLEASGGIDQDTLRSIAETGVDYISIGLLTKDCKAVDLSMRFI